MKVTLDHLRRYAIGRSLFKPTTLGRAIEKLGFVQADPIRAPARAQDLTLRHRVLNYRAGDLERRYPTLALEEDFLCNYGYLPRVHHQLMHPRTARTLWTPARAAQADALLAFVRERRVVHPREVDAHFAHGKVTNWFGGSSNASTQLLDVMHYRGLLRVARREGGTRLYAPATTAAGCNALPAPDSAAVMSRFDALVDILVRKYAPLPARSLSQLVSLLCGGAPQWREQRREALARAKHRLGHTRIDAVDWYWPPDEKPAAARWRADLNVRLLTPFDPIVWDRRRFEIFWNWTYRFEAYTPAPKRKLGYYALPLLWHERVVGWANVSAAHGRLRATFGYVAGRAPRAVAFRVELEAELLRMQSFLGIGGDAAGG